MLDSFPPIFSVPHSTHFVTHQSAASPCFVYMAAFTVTSTIGKVAVEMSNDEEAVELVDSGDRQEYRPGLPTTQPTCLRTFLSTL